MARDGGIVGCFTGSSRFKRAFALGAAALGTAALGTAALGTAATARSQPSAPTSPTSMAAVRDPTLGTDPNVRANRGATFVNPQRMLLDGPADASRAPSPRTSRRIADFPPPPTQRDTDFLPIAMLLAFPFTFALVRLAENAVTARRHHRLEPETDVARRVSLVFDLGARRRIRERIKAIARSPRADPYRTVEECKLVSVIDIVRSAAADATYASLETTMESRRGAAARMARWTDELGLAYRSQSMEMSASLVDEAIEQGERIVDDASFVLSILVHARAELPFPPERLTRETIDDVLASLVGERGFLVSYQLVWTPADEEDGVSASEIGSQHPDLVSLDAGASLLQKSCRFCGARHAADHEACPTCGAPAALEDERTSLDELVHVEDVECRQCGTMYPSNRYRCVACGAHRFTESGLPPPVERASLPPSPLTPVGMTKSTPPPSGDVDRS